MTKAAFEEMRRSHDEESGAAYDVPQSAVIFEGNHRLHALKSLVQEDFFVGSKAELVRSAAFHECRAYFAAGHASRGLDRRRRGSGRGAPAVQGRARNASQNVALSRSGVDHKHEKRRVYEVQHDGLLRARELLALDALARAKACVLTGSSDRAVYPSCGGRLDDGGPRKERSSQVEQSVRVQQSRSDDDAEVGEWRADHENPENESGRERGSREDEG